MRRVGASEAERKTTSSRVRCGPPANMGGIGLQGLSWNGPNMAQPGMFFPHPAAGLSVGQTLRLIRRPPAVVGVGGGRFRRAAGGDLFQAASRAWAVGRKSRKQPCRSGWCRGYWGCSSRGRRWASTRRATATSAASRRSTAPVRVPVHSAAPPFWRELASSFSSLDLLWGGGGHLNAS